MHLSLESYYDIFVLIFYRRCNLDREIIKGEVIEKLIFTIVLINLPVQYHVVHHLHFWLPMA